MKKHESFLPEEARACCAFRGCRSIEVVRRGSTAGPQKGATPTIVVIGVCLVLNDKLPQGAIEQAHIGRLTL
jgi:hypothetical protein